MKFSGFSIFKDRLFVACALSSSFLVVSPVAFAQSCADSRTPNSSVGGLVSYDQQPVLLLYGCSGFVTNGAVTTGPNAVPTQTNATGFFYLDGKPGLVVNVANGTLAPGSTDAVNGG